MKKNWINILKGIAIIFIILGHSPISKHFIPYAYSFDLPVFYFIAGYLFNNIKYENIKLFFKTRVLKILKPYLIFSLISIVLYCLIFQTNIFNLYTLEKLILAKRSDIFYNIPLWFLPSFFVTQSIYYFLRRYIKKDNLVLIVCLILSFIGLVYFKTLKEPKLFWTIDASIYYLLFFAIGNLFRKYKEKIYFLLKNKLWFILALIINMVPLFSNIYSKIWFTNSEIYYYFITVFLALNGIFTVICIAKYLEHNKLLTYIGNNSLVYFAMHVPVFFLIKRINDLIGINPVNSYLTGFTYLIITLLILTPFNKYLKRLI